MYVQGWLARHRSNKLFQISEFSIVKYANFFNLLSCFLCFRCLRRQSMWLFILVLCSVVPASWAAQSPNEDHFRIEQRHVKIHVNADGSSVADYYDVTSLLTSTGIDWFGEEKVSFSQGRESVKVLEAFTELPNGKRVELDPKAIRLVEDDQAGQVGGYSDTKAYAVIFPQLALGAKTHLRTHQVVHTPLYEGHYSRTFGFPLSVYFKDVVIDFSHDPAIKIKVETPQRQRLIKVKKLKNGSDGSVRYRFSYRNAKPMKLEEDTVSGLDIQPYIRVSSISSMLEVGQLYQEKAAKKSSVTTNIQALADDITLGIQDPQAQAQALYNWVATEIRYVAIFLGDGGVVPNDAESIVRNRYGDCKDHNTLLIALLAAKGIEAESVLINSGDTFSLPKLGGVAPFNHVITYLPAWNLYVDSTDRYAPFGVLSYPSLDKPNVHTQTLRYGRTPKPQALQNRISSEVTMHIHDDGSIVGQANSKHVGTSAIGARAFLMGYEGRYKDEIPIKQLALFGQVGTGNFYFEPMYDLTNPVQVSATFNIQPINNFPGPGAMWVPVGLAPGRIESFREISPYPVQPFPYVCHSAQYTQHYVLNFPSSVKVTRLPEPMKIEIDGYVYQSRYFHHKQAIIVERHLTLENPKGVCQPGDEMSFNKILSVVQKDLRGQIFYEPKVFSQP